MAIKQIIFFLAFLAFAYGQNPATFLSAKVSTAYNSKCTTYSGSQTVSPVPTTVIASKQYPAQTISTYAVTTPAANVFTTITTTTTTTITLTDPSTKRRRSLLNDTAVGSNRLKKRALYPTSVACAVTAIPVTFSYFTSTAASRTITRTSIATATSTTYFDQPTVTSSSFIVYSAALTDQQCAADTGVGTISLSGQDIGWTIIGSTIYVGRMANYNGSILVRVDTTTGVMISPSDKTSMKSTQSYVQCIRGSDYTYSCFAENTPSLNSFYKCGASNALYLFSASTSPDPSCARVTDMRWERP